HVDAEDLGATPVDREQGGQHAQHGRLARAVGAEDAEDLSGRDLEVDAVDGAAAAEGLDQPLGADGRGGRGCRRHAPRVRRCGFTGPPARFHPGRCGEGGWPARPRHVIAASAAASGSTAIRYAALRSSAVPSPASTTGAPRTAVPDASAPKAGPRTSDMPGTWTRRARVTG